MSNAVAAYEREDFNLTPPSENAANYSASPFKEHSARVKAANVKKLYGRLKVGDLIVVPGGPFDPLLFGEIAEPFNADDRIAINSRDIIREFQYRKVKWTRTDVIRASIPIKLQTYLSKPPAVAEVSRASDVEEFFPFAYHSYILKDTSFEFIDAPAYSGNNPRETEDANRLVSYFIAAYWAIEINELEKFAALDFDDALDKYYNPELLNSYEQVFKSPGHFAILAAAASLAGFVVTCTSLAVSDVDLKHLKSGITIENSSSSKASTPAESNIEKKVNILMKSLGENELKQIRKTGKRAKRNLQIKTKPVSR